MDLDETGYEGVGCIHLAQYSSQWGAHGHKYYPGSIKGWKIIVYAERLVAYQGLCSMEFVRYYDNDKWKKLWLVV
jgi:hypothetical protein